MENRESLSDRIKFCRRLAFGSEGSELPLYSTTLVDQAPAKLVTFLGRKPGGGTLTEKSAGPTFCGSAKTAWVLKEDDGLRYVHFSE